MTAVLYGVAETPSIPREQWPRDPIGAALSPNPCAVCGWPNGDAGDSHDRCRAAVERAERRGETRARQPRPEGFYWVRLVGNGHDAHDGFGVASWYDGKLWYPGRSEPVQPLEVAEWGERVDREAQR